MTVHNAEYTQRADSPNLPSIKVAILGASGYIGGEVLRLLLGHPCVQVAAATSGSNAGQPVSTALPHLTKLTDLCFAADISPEETGEYDAIFMALPHGQAIKRIPLMLTALNENAKGRKTVIFDLSGDFRIEDPATFKEYYGFEHTAPEWAVKAAYGLTEWNREAVGDAQLVACPGCFPTGALLALMPLAHAGLLGERVIIDSKTGSSGSGKEPGEGTHHPTRSEDFRAYSLFKHRHRPEIAQELGKRLPNGDSAPHVTFTPHSAPMVRGIFTTAYAFPPKPVSQSELQALYQDAYGHECFVRMVDNPRAAVVKHSNFCDISVATDGEGTVIVTSALDNLVKGGAGQGVQNLNVAFGLPEKLGLTLPGTMP